MDKQIIIDGEKITKEDFIDYFSIELTNRNVDERKEIGNKYFDIILSKEQECEAYKMEAEEGKEINAELKAENDLFRTCHDNEQAKRRKLEQTLTEIKEIVKPHQRNIDKICGHCRKYDRCHACCIDDINCYQYKKSTTPACDKYCELKEFEINNIAKQILQKISEVEE